MFKNLFEKYKKTKITAIKTDEELLLEYEKLKSEYKAIASSKVYEFLQEYFFVKIEIQRDIIEGLSLTKENLFKINQAQAQIKIMRDFIADFEDMKKQD